MSVANGQTANQTTFNNAFASKTQDNTLVGVQDLNNTTDPDSGAEITNAQRAINETFDAAGMTGINDANRKVYSSHLVIASGDDRKVAIGKLDARVGGYNTYLAEWQSVDIDGVTGTSIDVSSEFSGKVAGGSGAAVGVVTSAGSQLNRCEIVNRDTLEPILDSEGRIVFGYIQESGGVWDLDTFSVSSAGTEGAFTMTGQDITLYYREVFTLATRPSLPPVPSRVFAGPGGGSGSGQINHVSNPDGENNSVNDWATYADAAGVEPVNGVDGSPTVTWTNVASNQGRGNRSFYFTKDAADRQGEGVATELETIDYADTGKTIMCAADVKLVSGTYVDGDLEFFAYDSVTDTMIKGVGTLINGVNSTNHVRVVGFFKTTDYTPTNTLYRLIIHVRSASSDAYVLAFDNIVFGPIPDGVYQAVEGSRSAPTAVTAGGGVVLVAHPPKQTHFIEGDGAPVDVSANPQIAAGTTVGQELILMGCSDDDYVLLENGTGLVLNGEWYAYNNSVLALVFDGTNWCELYRRS